MSVPAHAKVVFRSRREGTATPATLVYALRSLVTSRPPAGGGTREIAARCYSSAATEVELRNGIEGEEATYDLALVPLDPNTPPGDNVPAWLIAQVRAVHMGVAWPSTVQLSLLAGRPRPRPRAST